MTDCTADCLVFAPLHFLFHGQSSCLDGIVISIIRYVKAYVKNMNMKGEALENKESEKRVVYKAIQAPGGRQGVVVAMDSGCRGGGCWPNSMFG